MDDRADLIVALAPVIGVLDRLGVVWYVGGSVASTVHGEFRATNDVDVIADLREEHAGPITAALEADYYVDEESICEAVNRRSSFNVVHLGTALKIDVFVAKPSAYETGVQARRVAVTMDSTGGPSRVWIASAEDVVLSKLVWFRRGGGISERQWRDVLGVVRVQGATLDVAYLRTWAGPLGVADLLDIVLAGGAKP